MYDYEIIEERDDLRLIIGQHDDPHFLNPREDDGGVGIMWCKHPDYTLGDSSKRGGEYAAIDEFLRQSPDESPEAITKHLMRHHGATVVKPLYLYDHSGLSMSAGTNLVPIASGRNEIVRAESRRAFIMDYGGWDTSIVGFIYDTEERRNATGISKESVEEAIDGEVKVYDQYLRGEVYYYSVERKVTVHQKSTIHVGSKVIVRESTSEEWETVESCGGFIGYKWVLQEGKSMLDYFAAHPERAEVMV